MDGFEMLIRDHADIAARFERFAALDDDAEAHEIGERLSAHAAAEEAALYPLVRKYVDDGDTLADRAEAEHAAVKNVVARMFEAPPTDLAELVRTLRDAVEAHVHEEETDLLPLLREVSAVDAEQLGAALRDAGLEVNGAPGG